MIDVQDHVVDDNWIVHPQNEELQGEVDFARAQWSQGDGDPVFFVADLIEGTVRSVIVRSEVVEEIDESVELERLMESFDPLKHPRGKDGKFINSGVKTSAWKKNSASDWAKKKIYFMSEKAAQGDWAAVQAAYTAPPAGAKGSAKYVYIAQQNLLKYQNQVLAEPAGAKPSESVQGASKGWKQVGPQLGSNAGGTYEGPDGKYYVKHPPTEDHARSEVLAAKLYSAAGAGVVDAQLVDTGNGKASVATKWIDSSSKVDWNNANNKIAASEDFAVHAWLGNWDAIGHTTDPNNVLSVNGKMVAVDVGGSLKYRAQGGDKPFDADCPEWHSLRDPSKAPMAAKVFGTMTPKQLYDSAQKLKLVDDAMIDQLCAKYHPNDASMPGLLKARKQAILDKADELAVAANLKPPIVQPKNAVVDTPEKMVAASISAHEHSPEISLDAAAKLITVNHVKSLGADATGYAQGWDGYSPNAKLIMLGEALGVTPGKSYPEFASAFNDKAKALGAHTAEFDITDFKKQAGKIDTAEPVAKALNVPVSVKVPTSHDGLVNMIIQDKAKMAGIDEDVLLNKYMELPYSTMMGKIGTYIGKPNFHNMDDAAQIVAMHKFMAQAKKGDLSAIVADGNFNVIGNIINHTPSEKHYQLAKDLNNAGLTVTEVADMFQNAASFKTTMVTSMNLVVNAPAKKSAQSEPASSPFADLQQFAAKPVPSIAPPPIFASKYGASNQAKVNKIHELASKGDIAGINAIKISTDSKDHYTVKAAQYKQQVLNSLGQGAKVSSDHVAPKPHFADSTKPKQEPKPVGEPLNGKIFLTSVMPDPPKFETSKAEIKKANEDAAAKAYELGMAGDVAGLKAMQGSQSPKLNGYVDGMIVKLEAMKASQEKIGTMPKIDLGNLEPVFGWESYPGLKDLATKGDIVGIHKMLKASPESDHMGIKEVLKHVSDSVDKHFNPPPPPPKPFDSKVIELAKKAAGNKQIGEKVGYWSIKGNVPLENTAIDHAWISQDHAQWHKDNASKKTSHMHNFTGGWEYYSEPMRQGDNPEHVKEARKQWNESAVELPEGMTLGRRYNVSPSKIAAHISGIKPGSIISDESFLSTSTSKTVWSGSSNNIHIRIKVAKGAKGVVAGSWSQHKSEMEVIMGPNARFLVVGIHGVPPAASYGGEKHVIDVVLLPPAD